MPTSLFARSSTDLHTYKSPGAISELPYIFTETEPNKTDHLKMHHILHLISQLL